LKLFRHILPPQTAWKGIAWTTAIQFLAACVPSFLESQYGTYAVPFWPASGTALAAVLLGGPWMLVGVYLALVLNGVGFGSFQSIVGHTILCLPNLAETAFGWLLLTRVAPDFQKSLPRLRDLGWFLLLAPWLPALVSSGLTQLALSLLSDTPREFLKEFTIYFLGNVTGILLVTPFLLVWRDIRSFAWKSPLGGMVAVLALVVGLGLFLHHAKFMPELGPLFASLLVPLALYGVWLTGLRGSSLLVLCSSLIYFAFDLSGPDSFLDFVLYKLQALDPQGSTSPTPAVVDNYYAYAEWLAGISRQLGFLGLMTGTILPLGSVLDELRRKTRTQSIAMQALETSFWSWTQEGGLTIENPSVATRLRGLEALFKPGMASGNMLIRPRPEGPDEYQSHWNVVSADRDGRPLVVVGLLQELTLHRERDSALAKADHLDLEVQTLRSHLNPHLLFNCLTGLRGLIAEDPATAREFASDLARFLREVVDSQSKSLIPVSDELRICEDFLRLEKLRGRPVKLESRIDPKADQALLPPLTLVTLLENAGKHGLKSSSDPMRIGLHATWDQRDGLQITVRQPGLLKKETARGTSAGLSLIRRQFEKLLPPGATVFLRQEESEWVAACVSIPATTSGSS
jgi:integral membrane sensor domain MASE1